jgi:hypothetical protein
MSILSLPIALGGHPARSNRMAVGLHGERSVQHLGYSAGFRRRGLGPGETVKQAGQIRERMKLRLIGEADPRCSEERNRIEVLRVETVFGGDRCIALRLAFDISD